jgi:flagellar biosynthesis protein FlhB
MSEKTEQPTARRLRKARQDGDVPVSGALNQAAGFFAALSVAPAAITSMIALFGEQWRAAVSGRALSAAEVASAVLSLSTPIIAAAAAASLAFGFVQTGGLVAPSRVLPKFERLSPLSGLKSLISAPRLLAVARALLASAALCWISMALLRKALPGLVLRPGELLPAAAVAASAARQLAFAAAGVSAALALIDLLVVRRAWLKRWMMTRDEVRREYRESEGDPEIKAARRRAHQEMLTSAQLHAVKDASVLIVNPTHLAIALRYDDAETSAPRVLAQGEGDFARRLIEAAHAYGVPVIRDVPVARALAELEVGDEIPEALYEAVAEILNEVWEKSRT